VGGEIEEEREGKVEDEHSRGLAGGG